MRQNLKNFLPRFIILQGLLLAIILLLHSHTVFALARFNVGTPVIDPANDVSIAVIDVTRVETEIVDDNLIVAFHLRDIPSELDFNKPGVPNGSIEYSWSVQIDVDNNSQTGNYDGYDYVCLVSHVKEFGDMPVTAPIEEVVEYFELHYEQGHIKYIGIHCVDTRHLIKFTLFI
jgi:hypothetical protein